MRTKRELVDIKKIEELASKMLTKEQIALSLGFSVDTLVRYELEDKEITKAIAKGMAKSVGKVANKLFETAMAGNVTAMIFLLKTRGGDEWKEKHDVNLTASAPITIKFVDDLKN